MAQGSTSTNIPFANTITRRYDGTSATTQYAGIAPSGTAESAALWTITRLLVANDGSVTVARATNVAWSNRASEIYS